jgi:hypothetical protein
MYKSVIQSLLGAQLDASHSMVDLGNHILQRFPLHKQSRLEKIYNDWRAPQRKQVVVETLANEQMIANPKHSDLKPDHRSNSSPFPAYSVSICNNINCLGILTSCIRLPCYIGHEVVSCLTNIVRLLRWTLRILNACVLSQYFAFMQLFEQPLDYIAEYFGENIAFYFAFLGFYTKWLIAPAALGIIVFALQVPH